jgi:CDP-paratose 2-epimerase
MSIWVEFAPLLERLVRRPVRVTHTERRTADQRIYVSDVRKAERALGWRPAVGVEEGIRLLHDWTVENLGQLGK